MRWSCSSASLRSGAIDGGFGLAPFGLPLFPGLNRYSLGGSRADLVLRVRCSRLRSSGRIGASASACAVSQLVAVGPRERSFFGHEPLRSTEIHSVGMSFLLSPESPHGVVSRRYAAEARSPATKLDLIGRTFVERTSPEARNTHLGTMQRAAGRQAGPRRSRGPSECQQLFQHRPHEVGIQRQRAGERSQALARSVRASDGPHRKLLARRSESRR
jgi:hypothetical protein